MTVRHEREYWRSRVRDVVTPASDDFTDELTDHLMARREAILARGGSAAQADAAAEAELRAWSGVTPPARPARVHPLVGVGLDWRGALRLLSWRPSFTAAAVILLTVAVGVGSATTAVVAGILARPLPFPSPNRLMTVWEHSVSNGTGQVSYPDAMDVRATGVFDATALFVGGVGTFTGGVGVERVKALFTEPAMLDILGARPLKGRLYTADDRGTANAVISYRLWQQQFGGAEDVVGRQFQLSGTPLTVIGVLPRGFDFEVPVARTFLLSDHDVWQVFDGPGSFETRRDVSNHQFLARLAPGVSMEQARAAVDAVAKRLAVEQPTTNLDRRFVVVPLHEIVTEAARPALRLATVAAALLIIAALANLGGLTLARARARAAELALRRALGASPLHMIRMILTEQLPLVFAGTGVGLLIGAVATRLLATSTQVRLPRPDAVAFDGLPIAAALLVGIAGLVVLATPMIVNGLRAQDQGASGRIAGHVSRRGHRLLVSGEVALALLLCVTAAAVSITLWRLAHADAGFDPSRRLTLRVSAYAADFPDREDAMGFFDTLRARVRQLPTVRRAAVASSLPLSGQFSGTGVMRDGGAGETSRVTGGWQHVSPGYFEAAGISIIRGRDFTDTERAHDGHVSILSDSMARRLFGSVDPIGQRIQAGGGDDWHEVVGVVEDVRHRSLGDDTDLRVYDLTGQHWSRTMYLIVHGGLDEAGALLDDVRRIIGEVAPGTPVFEVATGEDLRARATAAERLAARVSGIVAVAALVIAVFGVHAIVSASVAERRRELGVRMALGASRWSVARLVLTDAVRMAGTGAVVGIGLTVGSTQLLAAVLPGLGAEGIWPVISAVSVGILGASLAAAAPAARRAATTDPARVLQDATS